MIKKKKVFLILFSLLLVFTLMFTLKNNFESSSKIDKILKSESYSYLSPAAKNYVKEVYENTGELILTEKNKKKNEPYLNPKYALYLSLSEKEQNEFLVFMLLILVLVIVIKNLNILKLII